MSDLNSGASDISAKTVVELDLVGYSSVARELQEHVGVKVVADFDQQIQGFVDAGLAAIGGERNQIVLATTGDGAILAFDKTPDAHFFAVAVHEATQKHNAARNLPSSLRWFRIGAATGELYQGVNSGNERTISGTVIVDAVRLETACRPGQFLIDTKTYDSLPVKLQSLYGQEETVVAKSADRLAARRCTMVPYLDTKGALPAIESILELFDQLNPRDQLDTVMIMLGMPEPLRPPATLDVFRRQEKILDWAANEGDAVLSRLDKTLKRIIKNQRRPPRVKLTVISLAVVLAAAFAIWWFTGQSVIDVPTTFPSRMKIGDMGDIRIDAGAVGADRFVYIPAGNGPHEWDWKFVEGRPNNEPAHFGGIIYYKSNFPSEPGTSHEDGFDAECCRHKIVWEARSVGGPVKTEFFCGGIDWRWIDGKQSAVPYGDTLKKQGLGTKLLTDAWQTFEYPLSEAGHKRSEFKRVIGGFGWVIQWPSKDPQPEKTMTIELRNIRYLR